MTERSVVEQQLFFLCEIEIDKFLLSAYHPILNISPSDIAFTAVLLFRKCTYKVNWEVLS